MIVIKTCKRPFFKRRQFAGVKQQNDEVEVTFFVPFFLDLVSIQNGPKDKRTSTLENGKCERHDEEINEQTSTDVQTFKQVSS